VPYAFFFFYQKCMIFILDIQQTFENNSRKFQLKKRLIGSREMNFYLHAPMKSALKRGTSQKSTWDTQLGWKRHRTWTVGPNKTILESFCRKMNALLPGYNTFGKIFCRCRIIDSFCERSDLLCFSNFGVSLLWRLLLGAPESLQGLVPEMSFPMIYNSYIILQYFIPYSAF
jgi:hypothetical protein